MAIPKEKRQRAIDLLNIFIGKKKSTVKELQRLARYLNFLNRAIFPGRSFTQRMYTKFKSGQFKKLKNHHHVRLDSEFKEDCKTWLEFLTKKPIETTVCRPWVDLMETVLANVIEFYSDTSGSKTDGGMGTVFGDRWMLGKWNQLFMTEKDPSIEFLELFALTVAVLAWSKELKNNHLIIFCDNQSVVSMVNNTSSSCKNGMTLICHLVKEQLKFNFRIFARHVRTEDNGLSDALSRGQMKRFWNLCSQLGKHMELKATSIPSKIWPPEKIWID